MKTSEDEKSSKMSDRITQIRAFLCNDSNIIFASKINKSTQYASALCKGSSNPGKGMLEELLTAFPAVNRSWLYFGEGPMLTPTNTNNQSNIHVEGDNIINGSSKNTMDGFDRLLDIITSQQKTIHQLSEQVANLIDLINNRGI